MSTARNRLLVGIGNELRGDDGVGPFILRSLRASGLQGVDCLLLGADVTVLTEALGMTGHAYVFDAMRSGAPPGTVHRIDALNEELPKELSPCSSHGFTLADVFKLADVLGKLPETLAVFGVEGETFELGRGLSAPVRAAAAAIVCDVTWEFTRSLPRESDGAHR